MVNTGGMMCIPVEKGMNNIVFRYFAIDNLVGGIITIISFIIFGLYIIKIKKI